MILAINSGDMLVELIIVHYSYIISFKCLVYMYCTHTYRSRMCATGFSQDTVPWPKFSKLGEPNLLIFVLEQVTFENYPPSCFTETKSFFPGIILLQTHKMHG